MKKNNTRPTVLGLKLLLLTIIVSSFISIPHSSLKKNPPIKSLCKDAKSLKPITVHLTGSFSLCSNCATIFTYSMDVTFEADILSRPPKITVLSVHGTICWGNTNVCGTFRASNIINNIDDDDTIQIDYEALTTIPPSNVQSALDSDEFLQHIRSKIIEHETQN